MIKKAIEFCQEKKYGDSIDLLKEVRRSKNVGANSKRMRMAYVLEAYSRFRLGDYEQAIDLWNKSIDVAKDSSDVPNILAFGGAGLLKAYQDKGDMAEIYTMSALDMLLAFPDGSEKEWIADFIMPHVIMCGVVFIHSKNFSGAIRILEKAIKVSEWLESSNDPDIARSAIFHRAKSGYWYATALDELGRYRDAIYQLTTEVIPRYEAIEAISEMAIACSKVGLMDEQEKDYLTAFKWYEECLKAWKEVGDEVQIRQAQKDVDRMSELPAKGEGKPEQHSDQALDDMIEYIQPSAKAIKELKKVMFG